MRMYDLGSIGMIWAIFILGIYFLPAFIAFLGNHKNKLAIFFLNILLGWTVLGWVVSIVWSVMK